MGIGIFAGGIHIDAKLNVYAGGRQPPSEAAGATKQIHRKNVFHCITPAMRWMSRSVSSQHKLFWTAGTNADKSNVIDAIRLLTLLPAGGGHVLES